MTAAFDPASADDRHRDLQPFAPAQGLLSITAMDPKPGRVIVTDNDSSDDTTEVVESFRNTIGTELVYNRLETNTGGSGGFSAGMQTRLRARQ